MVAASSRDGLLPSFPSRAYGLESANRLVTTFSYLCPRGARKFVRSGVDRSDLEQVAAVGLIKASRRYDADAETPFEAYAWLMIVGELMHYVRDHEHAIRIPRRLLALERDVANAHDALSAELKREPTDADIARRLAVSPNRLASARRVREVRVPLPIEDAHASVSAGDALLDDDRLFLRSAFATLGALERRIVAGVYLLGLSQMQLARSLDLPPKRVSRIHLGALARMRRAWPA
jgi:RNA polymerase sigma-B factor